jgi:outer membrane protein
MKIKILLAICLIAFCFQAKSQQSDSGRKVYTLKECVDIALGNNLTVKRGLYNVKSYEVAYNQAKFALAPTLNASLSAGKNAGRSLNFANYQYTTQVNNSFQPNLSTSVTLFNGFRLQNNIRQTSKDYEASESDLQKSRNDVILTTITNYLNVILNKELYENAKYQLNSSEQQLERTKKQVDAGALPKSSALNLDAQVATNELNVINRENAINISLLQLNQALQLPANSIVEIEIPEIEISDLILEQSRDEIFAAALQTMPEIKSANLKVESSQYAVRAAKGNLIPRVTVNGSMNSNYSSVADAPRADPSKGYTISDSQVPIGYFKDSNGATVPITGYEYKPAMTDGYSYKNQLQDYLSKSVSITLNIPIFNGLQNRIGVQRAAINREVAKINAEQASNTLRQSVETAYNDALASSKSYNASLRQVNAREEAYRMTKQRYENGAATFVEFEVSQNDLFQAKSDLLRAKYDFIFRKKVLDFYQGKAIEF